MIKNYPLLFALLFLQSVTVQSAMLPEKFSEGLAPEFNGWLKIDAMKNDKELFLIPQRFEKFQEELSELNKNGLVTINIDDEKTKQKKESIQQAIDQIDNKKRMITDEDVEKNEKIEKFNTETGYFEKKKEGAVSISSFQLNKDVLIYNQDQILKQFIGGSLNAQDNAETQLSVYFQTLIATFSPMNKIDDEFIHPLNGYRRYILGLSIFFNWYTATKEDKISYVDSFAKLAKQLINNVNFKLSYIALIKDGLQFYKQYRSHNFNEDEDQIKKQICQLLEQFKATEEFKNIYEENKEEKLKPEAKKWGISTYLGIAALLGIGSFALYNYKKILEYLQTKWVH